MLPGEPALGGREAPGGGRDIAGIEIDLDFGKLPVALLLRRVLRLLPQCRVGVQFGACSLDLVGQKLRTCGGRVRGFRGIRERRAVVTQPGDTCVSPTNQKLQTLVVPQVDDSEDGEMSEWLKEHAWKLL